ncbi:hypothetical protein EZS27_007283 [termite gut metagenome]|uniref:Transposase IS200-like domain-containing protein n=1 Tax=termite gut metagenome TaxID=433724 RepID=A0A5J4SG33_9ZZZZ
MNDTHHRRSIRLKGYDYSQAGLYFVTMCCQDKICRFGKIEKGEMILNESGQIAYDEWVMLPERYSHVTLDVFQIMPNHIHGIIALNVTVVVGATLAVAQNAVAPNNGMNIADGGATANGTMTANRATASVAPTIGNMVGVYKSLVMNKCLEIYKSKNECMGKLWQRNYYEHIIRNEQSYQNISNYIINNPANWKDDTFYGT